MRRDTCWLLTLAAVLAAPLASAQQPPGPGNLPNAAAPESRQAVPGGEQAETESPNLGLWERGNLLGDPGGLRTRLSKLGISLGLNEQAEVFGSSIGGVRQGAIFEGLLTMSVGVDAEKAFGLPGGTFNVSAYQIHGRGLSLNDLDNNLSTVSSIEALRGTLLFELWYEQVLPGKRLAIRVGQLAADQEFMVSQYAGLFLNHTFGWSDLPSADLPSGGPAYPLATPGIRVRYNPRDDLAVLIGILNGNPAGPGTDFPQQRDAAGTAFLVNDGVLAIGEVQYSINAGEGARGLPGTYKLGAWYNSNTFLAQRAAVRGRLPVNPAVAPAPAFGSFAGNWSVYGVMDQLVWREPGTKDQGWGVFARAMGAPGDRNLVNVYADAGVTRKGLTPVETRTRWVSASRSRATATRRPSSTATSLTSPGSPIRFDASRQRLS